MGYSNFKDPIGLLKRMLLSGNKVAYSVLVREFLSKLLIPVDFVLRPTERRILKSEKKKLKRPMILILGGSRSGTTLLYQTLVRYLDVSYVSNFISAFASSPISAYSLFKNIIPKAGKSFQNYYGSVAGLGGPNDAFVIWNRWLGEDRNRIPNRIEATSKRDMKNFFQTWFAVSKKPFINKNNRNSLCAPLFAEVFDNVVFVEIHRNPIYVAQSLVLSRRMVQGSDKVGWGVLGSDSQTNHDSLHYIDEICEQVYTVDQIIAKGREKIKSEDYIRISYEEFCRNPDGLVRAVGSRTKTAIKNPEHLKRHLFSSSSNQQRLTDREFNRICECIDKLYKNDFQGV